MVQSGPCKKISVSILQGDMLIANLVSNSWLEAMKYTVQIKVLIVLRHLALVPLPAFQDVAYETMQVTINVVVKLTRHDDLCGLKAQC